jgi:4'-phosphopantetheinyl transferase
MTPAVTLPDDVTAVSLPVKADSAATSWEAVKVWTIAPKRVSTPLERLLVPLDDSERERARRKRTDGARRAYAIAHARLREILAAETGADLDDIRFVRQASTAGKPALAENTHDLTFNLSHTHGLIAVAVARGREVGVDVEWLGRKVRASSLAHRYFTESELSQVSRAPEHARTQCFLRLWTRREAHAKMTGEGLGRAVADGAGDESPFGGAASQILELDLAPDHIGAVAVSTPPRSA